MPPQPTAQTSVLALPHTPQTRFVVPLETEDHTVPSQCRIVPVAPPGGSALLPQPWFVVPLETEDNTVPSLWRMVPFGQPGGSGVPPQPTAQTSVLALPHTP